MCRQASTLYKYIRVCKYIYIIFLSKIIIMFIQILCILSSCYIYLVSIYTAKTTGGFIVKMAYFRGAVRYISPGGGLVVHLCPFYFRNVY